MKISLLISLLFASLMSFASIRIEAWKNGEELNFVERDEKGLFKRTGILKSEEWKDGTNQSRWVARFPNGQFVTGYTGSIGKFKTRNMKKEEQRLVIRSPKGQFVTWKAVDELFDAGFEAWDVDRDGKEETVYVIRYNGNFVDWAVAKLENWKNFKHPVLAVRDSADGQQNGQLLAWIAATITSRGQVVYKDPETGRFVSPNK